MAAGKHTRPTLSSGGVCNTGQKRRKGQSINWTSSGLVIGLLCRKSLESLYRWHIYVNESMTWTDAQQYCRKHHDDLSTTSAIEVKLLSANPKVTSDFFWIGLRRDSQSPLLWKWSGGENASNVQWDVTQPDTLHEQCAAVLKSNGKLHDAACFLSIPFYCMEVIELILVQKENTWIEALEYCRQNHVDLAGLTSDLMMREAKNKSAPAHADDVWIGLRFIASHWFLDGSNVDYKGWSLEGEPQCPPVDQRWFDKKRWFGNLTAVSGDSTFSVSRNIKRYKE